MDIGQALEKLKEGKRVARAGWNGKGMWLILIDTKMYEVCPFSNEILLPWIGMKTVDDKFVPWLASQTDILAEDWEAVK